MNLNYFIIIISVIIAILQLGEIFERKKIRWRQIFIIVLLITIAALSLINEHQTSVSEESKKNAGVLSGKLYNDTIIYPSINLGGARLVYTGQDGDPLFNIGKDKVTIWIENGELKLSTIIRNKDGEIVAELEANEWKLNTGQYYKRNFDKNGLEVIDHEGMVVLQADFDGESVNFAGIFYQEDGWTIAIGPAEFDSGGIIEKRPPGEKIQTKFKPIFQYPSELHFGERVR